jgi:hypothetical protein
MSTGTNHKNFIRGLNKAATKNKKRNTSPAMKPMMKAKKAMGQSKQMKSC